MTQATPHDPTIGACERCGDPCRVNPNNNPDARLLRFAKEPKGLCANCAVTQWFFLHEEIMKIGDLPGALLVKPIQDQFIKVMQAGNADMKPNEIDWQKVVKNWHFPFPKHKKTRPARSRRGS